MKYLIVEDEYILGRRLERLVSELRPDWQLLAKTAGVEETVTALKTLEPDMVFMDIELADGNCFEIFDAVEVRMPIIFTAAYDNYTLDAFKQDTIDYLLKPVGKPELLRAIEKLERLAVPVPDYAALSQRVNSGNVRERILISEGNAFSFVRVSDIAWFLSNERYTDLRLFSGQHHMIDRPLNTLEQELDRRVFFRATRNCIVNINAIASIQRFSGGRLKIRTNPPSDAEILVSQARRDEFLHWVGGEG